jgi:hypothetical protein
MRRSAPTGRSYVPLPFDGDLDALLKLRLEQAKGREDFARLLKAIQQDPGKFKLDDKALQERLKGHLENPLVRREIEEAQRQHKDLLKLDSKAMKGFKDVFKGMESRPPEDKDPDADGPKPQPVPTPIHPGTGPTPGGPGQSSPPPASASQKREGALDEWLRDRMTALESSKVGQVLRDSPAFQQGLLDLEEAILEHRGELPGWQGWDVGPLGSRVEPPEWAVAGLENSLLKLHGMHLPSLPRPNLGLGGLGSWKLPAPSADGSGLGVGRVLLWLLFLAAVGLLLWQVLARLNARASNVAGGGWQLGPWPVHPARIASREELVRAFDYLSLLVLGPAARAWHHLAVADGLAAGAGLESARRANAAAELAALYEQARYAPSDGPMPAEALAAARRDLCLLAGVAHA